MPQQSQPDLTRIMGWLDEGLALARTDSRKKQPTGMRIVWCLMVETWRRPCDPDRSHWIMSLLDHLNGRSRNPARDKKAFVALVLGVDRDRVAEILRLDPKKDHGPALWLFRTRCLSRILDGITRTTGLIPTPKSGFVFASA